MTTLGRNVVSDRMQPRVTKVPKSYWWWLFGTVWTLLGTQALSYALAWFAAGIDGSIAGLVLTSIALPRVLFALTGGSVADRVGAWRVMVVSDGSMIVLSAVIAVVAVSFGSRPWLLVAIGLLLGLVDAFYRPAAGSFPRLLAPDDALPRATAFRQITIQGVGLVGPALGGAVIALAGLQGSAIAAGIGYLVMFAVLLALRSAAYNRPAPRKDRSSLIKDALNGIRVAASSPVLRGLLGLLAVVTGFVLPLTTLLVPLLAHQRGWSVESAGIISGGYAGGLGVAAILVIVRGASALRWLPPVAGVVLTGLGMIVISLVTLPLLAFVSAVLAGFGAGLFSAKTAPALLLATPRTHVSRIQAIALLAQTVPLLVTNNLLGFIGEIFGSASVTFACGALVALIGVVALMRPSLRDVGR